MNNYLLFEINIFMKEKLCEKILKLGNFTDHIQMLGREQQGGQACNKIYVAFGSYN
jgi:hypothetical protein